MPRSKFILVIGTSAGGNEILPELLNQLNVKMNLAVFVVTHLSKHSIGDLLVKRLQKHTALTCKIPNHGESIKTKHIYVARPDHHLMLKDNKIMIGKGPMENRYRPSIDALFRSAAAHFGNHVIGIVLTGLLEDGVAGMLAIKRSGGICIIQDPNEAKYPDMPKAVLNTLKPDYALPVEQMGEVISEILKRPVKKTTIPADIIKEAQIAERVNISISELKELGKHSLFSCPDCGGGLWEMESNGATRYRCHVGHAYTEHGLLSAMESSTESALWTALRIIEERRNLLKKLLDKERKYGTRTGAAANYGNRIDELETHITQLKKVLFSLQRD